MKCRKRRGRLLLVGAVILLFWSLRGGAPAAEPPAGGPSVAKTTEGTESKPSPNDNLEGDASQQEKEGEAAGHDDPVTPLLLAISVVLLAAKVGGDLMVRVRQPAVLGELLVGVVLGNLVIFGFDGLEFLRPLDHAHGGMGHGINANALASITLDALARIGVILLLFEVGMESSVNEMCKVGWSSLLVATLGVIAPFALGWMVGKWMLPQETWHVHMFLGATLCATSVGITARVLKDLKKSDSKIAKIVLGAAVIDDVMGLVVLAVVQAIIQKGTAEPLEIAIISGKALGFLLGAVILGDWLSPKLFRVAASLRVHGMLMVTALAFCFGLAWCSSQMGLAPIVGAFAAGLILDEKHYASLLHKEERSLEDWVMPVTTLMVPIFFVMMGFNVDLRSFMNPQVLLLAGGITAAAIIGKQVCAFGVLERQVDRLSVGIGMIPRGEVGLIFAAIGQGLHDEGKQVVNASVYSAIVVMVIVTTLITPPLLSWSLRRSDAAAGEAAESGTA